MNSLFRTIVSTAIECICEHSVKSGCVIAPLAVALGRIPGIEVHLLDVRPLTLRHGSGATVDALRGVSPSLLVPEATPAANRLPNAFIRELAGPGGGVSCLYIPINIDGTEAYMLVHIRGMGALGDPGPNTLSLMAALIHQAVKTCRAFGSILDDLALKSDVLERMAQGLTVSDESGVWIYANPAYAQLSGRNTAELVGTRPDDLAAPEDANTLAHARRLRAEGKSNSYEMTIVRPDGTTVPVQVSGAPRWINGRPCGAVAVTTDLTLMNAAAKQREAIIELERELNARKRQFVRTAAHECRGPLAAISYAAELLGHSAADASLRNGAVQPNTVARFADTISGCARSLSSLMENLLLLERMEEKQAVAKVKINVADLITEAIRDVAAVGQEGRIEWSAPAAGIHYIVGDRRLARYVLTNLISNALKYSPHEAPVRISARMPQPTAVEVSVHDSGIGIPEADQEKLFSTFFRARNVAGRPGSGLGLKISRDCAEAMGGSLTFESLVGHGTVFRFLIEGGKDH